MPFWFSLATYGTRKYHEAIDRTIEISRWTAEEIDRREYLEMAVEPELSVVVFRRKGWTSEDYDQWCALTLRDEVGFVLPTTFRGEKLLRFCFVNPLTDEDDVRAILDTMAWDPAR